MLRIPKARPENKQPPKKEREGAVLKGDMQIRVVVFAMLVAVVFLVLAARLWQLQVLTGEDYNNLAQATKTREMKIPAQRGVIYDRNGEVLANNSPGLNVTVVPSMISREKLSELAEVLNADRDAVLARYDSVVQVNPYEPILVKENAERDAITYVSERTGEFPGLSINSDYVRNYPDGNLASHVLGYTGAVTAEELKSGAFEGVAKDAVVGKGGVELAYEEALSGEPGAKEYNVDAYGRIVPQGAQLDAMGRFVDKGSADTDGVDPRIAQPSNVVEPVPGNDLKLTLDRDLQETAEKELNAAMQRARAEGASGDGGAVVAIDPRNGEIRAMASEPDFNPQLFVGGVTGAEELQEYERLSSKQANSPFTNRAITGSYPGASAFKVFTGLAGFYYGVIDPETTVTDNGGCWRPTGISMGCWLSWRQTTDNKEVKPTHGTQNFAAAIRDSNDKFFYQVADWLWNRTGDPNALPEFYTKFGFGSLTGVDLPGETEGRIPTKEWFEWYQRQVYGELQRYWGVGDWVNLSIGQGDMLLSPVQMAQAYAAVQNGGTLVTPHVGQEIRDQSGKLVKDISPEPEGTVRLDPVAREEMLKGFRRVTGPKGTAAPAFIGSELSVLGKSGTGEVGNGEDPVNWFAAWAEDQEETPLVVVVMVEGGEHSEVTGAPAARKILEAHHGVKSEDAISDESLVDAYAGSDVD